MISVGLVVSTQSEFDYFVKEFQSSFNKTPDVKGSFAVFGLDDSFTLIVSCSGVGKVNAAIAIYQLKYLYGVESIISIGTGGGTREKEKVFDFIVGEKLFYLDVDVTTSNYKFGQLPDEPEFWTASEELMKVVDKISWNKSSFFKGTIGTSDTFCDWVQKEHFEQRFKDQIDCVEMEGCAIAHCCRKLAIPSLIIRCLSDIPSLNESCELQLTINFQRIIEIESEFIVAFIRQLKLEFVNKNVQ